MGKIKKNDLIRLKENLIIEMSKENGSFIEEFREIFIVKKVKKNGELILENDGIVLKIVSEKFVTKKGVYIN